MLKLGTSSDKLVSASAGSHCTAVLLLFMICLFAFSCAINDDDDDDDDSISDDAATDNHIICKSSKSALIRRKLPT